MESSDSRLGQAHLIEEATGFVAEQRFFLQKAIKQNDLDLAVRCALKLANELRTTRLTPQNYYKVYMFVFWELQHLAAFLLCTERHGLDLADVYQVVQHEGNILPRLYMLVTLGVVRIQHGSPDADAILADLASLLTAVQHPFRGLFVRYYLLQMTKDKLLPCLGVEAALNFLLSNFMESASLWERLRHENVVVETSPASFVDTPVPMVWNLDDFRGSLRLLVNAHLMQVVRLTSGSTEIFEGAVLPVVLQRSISCEDPAGKACLLDCFIEAFPDHYLVAMLEKVLAACAEVQACIDLKRLLQRIMRRLTSHLKHHSDVSTLGATTFSLLQVHLQLLHKRPPSVATPLASLLELQLELLFFTLALLPSDVERVELVLKEAVVLLGRYRGPDGLDPKSTECIVNFLAAPLTHEQLVPLVLAMPHHPSLIGVLDHSSHREGAVAMVSALLAGDVGLCDPETLDRLFALIDPLIHDEPAINIGVEQYQEFDLVAFTAEQEKVAKLVHQVRHSDVSQVFRMLISVRKHFLAGGPHRITYTLPALVVGALRLVMQLANQQKNDSQPSAVTFENVLSFVYETCQSFESLEPDRSMSLWLLCVSTVNRADITLGCMGGLSNTCTKFIDRAFTILENDIRAQQGKFKGLSLMVGTLREIQCLNPDDYLKAADRALRYISQLIAKKLQSKAYCFCATLFWSLACQQPSQALCCIRQALRLADGAIHQDPYDIVLFVEALDQSLWLFEAGNKAITPAFLVNLLTLCTQHVKYIEGRAPAEARRALACAAAFFESKSSEEPFGTLLANGSVRADIHELDLGVPMSDVSVRS